ncbi:MAG: hypothetical protein K8H88_08120 [Sandaracinaceae bacterium]|nr:hypothetical protein [Sandaracinaceae bacterium]
MFARLRAGSPESLNVPRIGPGRHPGACGQAWATGASCRRPPPATCTCAARALPTAQELAAKDAELRAALDAQPPFLRMFYAAHGELLDRLYDDWLPCEALVYVLHPDTLAELLEHRHELAERSPRMPEELAVKRSLAGIPVVADDREAKGRMRCVVREGWYEQEE